MTRTIFPSLALIALLTLVGIIAGLVGGAAFAPDADAIVCLMHWRQASPGLTQAVIAITQLGSAYVTIGGGVLAAAWLALHQQRLRALIMAGAVAADRLVLDGSKLLVDRPRPAFDPHPVMVTSTSFPSGHAGNSMAVFLAIALIAVPARYRLAAVIVAVTASLIVGLTRPYLGVHWPSDVVGGWAIGAAVAVAASLVAQRWSVAPQQQHEIIGGHDPALGQD